MLSGRERYLTSRRLLSQLLACLLLVSIFSVAAPRTTATTPTAHAPIFINGNADFTAANGVTGGTGTSADPYVISYWDINLHQGGQWGDCGPDPSDCILVYSAPYCLGIQVQNTRAYFVIQNVSIHDGYPNSLDISFSNVTNGQVESSNLTSYSGISIINSGNVTVSGNNVAIPQYSLGAHSGYDDGPGLQIGSSSYVTISGNSFTVWREPDIRLTGDSNLVISNNNFVGSSSTNNSQALDMTNLVNSTIQNNQITDTDLGFIVDGGNFSGNVLSGNVFSGNGYYSTTEGISFGPSTQLSSNIITTDNLVEGRPIYYFEQCSGTSINGVPVGELLVVNCSNFQASNLSFDGTAFEDIVMFSVHGGSVTNSDLHASVFGLFAWNSDHVTVSSNNVTSGNGIQFYNTDNMFVYHNNFLCAGSGCDTATDYLGTNNLWDNGYPSGGNFWWNYPGVDNCSGPQQNVCPNPDGIADTAFGHDRYPLMKPFVASPDPSPSVGGAVVPVDKLALLGPFVLLAMPVAAGTVLIALYSKRIKTNKGKMRERPIA